MKLLKSTNHKLKLQQKLVAKLKNKKLLRLFKEIMFKRFGVNENAVMARLNKLKETKLVDGSLLAKELKKHGNYLQLLKDQREKVAKLELNDIDNATQEVSIEEEVTDKGEFWDKVKLYMFLSLFPLSILAFVGGFIIGVTVAPVLGLCLVLSSPIIFLIFVTNL